MAKRKSARKTDVEERYEGFCYALNLLREAIALIPSEALVRDALLETLYELEEFADEKESPQETTLVWLYFHVLKRGEVRE